MERSTNASYEAYSTCAKVHLEVDVFENGLEPGGEQLLGVGVGEGVAEVVGQDLLDVGPAELGRIVDALRD